MFARIGFYSGRVKISLGVYFCFLFLFLLFKVFLAKPIRPEASLDTTFAVAILEASITKSAKKPQREPEPVKEAPPSKPLTEAELEAKLEAGISESRKEEQARLDTSIRLEAERAEKERLEMLEQERLEKERIAKEKRMEAERKKKEEALKKAEAQRLAAEKLALEKKQAEQRKQKADEAERKQREAVARKEAEEKRKLQEQTPVVEADYLDPKLNNAKPKQPLSSIKAGEQGEVVLSVRVAADGTIIDVTIAKSSGYTRLDNAAMYTVKTWRLHPAKNIFGQNIAQTIFIPFKFELTSRGE